MRVRILLIIGVALLLSGCSSSRKVIAKKKVKTVVVEPEPEKLPSVRQIQHVRKLKRSGKSLNKYTLAYIRKYAPMAVLEMHKYKIPASITLAQGILESGNGRSNLARKSNNHFGIKCHKKWRGKRVYHDDDAKGECFRKYTYVQTSYKDHSKFLSGRKRYENLFKLNIKDYKGWARGLKKAGYATDRRYPRKLIKIIQEYQLYRFDNIKKRDLKNWDKTKDEPEIVIKDDPVIKNEIPFYYVVKKGDTLYSIAKKYNTTVAHLKEINELTSNNLSIGQRLLVK